MSKRAVTIELTAAERSALEDLAKRRRTTKGLARRARIVLTAAEGKENKAISQEIGADEKTVANGAGALPPRGVTGLYDEPRSRAPRRIEDDEIAEAVRLTLETTPAGRRTDRCAGWPKRSTTRLRPSIASGEPFAFSRTVLRGSAADR